MNDCRHCTPCALERIEGALSRMEIMMARETDALNEIKNKLADVHADVRARLDQVRGELSPEGQQEIDSINDALASFDVEVGDADGSDVPATGGTESPAGDGPDATPTA